MTTLAELRRANLEEQRTPEPTPDSASTEVRESAGTDVIASVLPQVRTEVRKSASKAVRQEVSKQPRTPASTPVRNDASTDLLERVREALAQKKTHAGGVKTTVEMTPELNRRAKQYCLDHGNLPVRQVFLELMAAFLDEEGY